MRHLHSRMGFAGLVTCLKRKEVLQGGVLQAMSWLGPEGFVCRAGERS